MIDEPKTEEIKPIASQQTSAEAIAEMLTQIENEMLKYRTHLENFDESVSIERGPL